MRCGELGEILGLDVDLGTAGQIKIQGILRVHETRSLQRRLARVLVVGSSYGNEAALGGTQVDSSLGLNEGHRLAGFDFGG